MASQTPFERVTNKALGELLVERGVISRQQCDEALAYARQHGKRIGEALVELGFVPPGFLSLALGEQFGTTPLVLDPTMVDAQLIQRFPLDLLRKHLLLPLLDLGGELIVAVGDPNDSEGLEAFSRLVPDRRLVFQLGDAAEIERCLWLPQLAGSTSSQPPSAEAHAAFESLLVKITEVCRRDPGRRLLARGIGQSVQWWIEEASVAEITTNPELPPMDTAAFYKWLDSEVRWLQGCERTVGFLETPPEGRIAVVGALDLNGLLFTFRWLCPWESMSTNVAPPPPLPETAVVNAAGRSAQEPLPCTVPLGAAVRERLVILLYVSKEALGAMAAAYAADSPPPTLLMATVQLPWLYSNAVQLPASGMWMVPLAQSLGCRRVFFDDLPSIELLSAFLLGCPRVEQVVVAISCDRWNKHLLPPLLATCEGAFVEVTNGGWRRLDTLTNHDFTTRR